MLHSYSFTNFRAFPDRVEVSLRLTPADPVNGWALESPSGDRLTTALAVIGPNASGKTTLLQPLAFLQWFMSNSFSLLPDEALGITPHFAHSAEPSDFELIMDGDEPESVFRYHLSATNMRVIYESLEKRSSPRSQFRKIFDRHEDPTGYQVEMADEFPLDRTQALNARPNVSLISLARQFGVRIVEPAARWASAANLSPHGWAQPHPFSLLFSLATQLQQNPARLKRVRSLIKKMDLGLSDIEIREFVRQAPANSAAPLVEQKRIEWAPWGLHRDGKTTFELPFWAESSGTQTAFNLLAIMLVAIETGGVMIHDELDNSLHPHLIEPLLNLFASKESNPHGAQIIFTTHAAETVLRFLQKSQAVLVEKDGIVSTAYRLDEVEGVRADDNRATRYRSGAYGAIPRV